jgi:hypothetical protein
MKKNYFLLSFMVLMGLGISFTSCKKDDTTTVDPGPTEYIATNDSFKSIESWTLGAENLGVDPSLGAAHAGNDSTVTRSIYFKDNAKPANGKYPVGSIVVKHSHNPAGTVAMYTAMVKRGNNFDAANGDWEYFMLAGDGQIAKTEGGMEMRGNGATMLNGMCLGCHTNASSKDYIFTNR